MGSFRRTAAGFVLALGAFAGCSLTNSLEGLSGPSPVSAGDGGPPGTLADGARDPSREGGGDTSGEGGGPGTDGPDGAAPGPIAFVQSAANNLGGSGTGSLSFPSAVTAGNAIIIVAEYDSTASVTITDGTTKQYTYVVGAADAFGSRSVILAAFDHPGGARNYTVTLGDATASYLLVYLHEYRGLRALDDGAWTQGTSRAANGMDVGVTTTERNGLLFAFGFSTYSVTAGTGFTLRSNFYMNVTQDRLLGDPGMVKATATMTSGTGWKILAAAFKGP